MSGTKIRERNGMTSVDESDLQHYDTDFIPGAGVVDMDVDYLTTQDTGSNRNVLVSTGAAYIRNNSFVKNTGLTRFYTCETEDATTTLAIDPNTTLATRVDYVCLKFDSAANPDATGTNVCSIVNVKGTSNAVAPPIPADHLVLARLDLEQNFTAVTNAKITDMRVQAQGGDGWRLIDKSEDPLAVGGTLAMVQYVSASSLKISGDWRNKINQGMIIRLTQSGSEKFFTIADNGAFSASYTTFNIVVNDQYTLANAVATKAYYSVSPNPSRVPAGVSLASLGWQLMPMGTSGAYTRTGNTTFTCPTGVDPSKVLQVGDKLRYLDGGSTYEYSVVTSVNSTTVTLSCGTDYGGGIANNPTIVQFSKQSGPNGMPASFTYISTAAVSGGTAPTYTGTDTGKFWVQGRICHYQMLKSNSAGGTAGSGGSACTFTLPINTASTTSFTRGPSSIYNNATGEVNTTLTNASTTFVISKASTAFMTGNDQNNATRIVSAFVVYDI